MPYHNFFYFREEWDVERECVRVWLGDASQQCNVVMINLNSCVLFVDI